MASLIIFTGNIGVAQDVKAIIDAALILKEKIDIHFVFIGDGRSKIQLENFVSENNLKNTVHFLGRFPLDAMKSFFNQADVLLVSLKDELIFNVTVPAKLQASSLISNFKLSGHCRKWTIEFWVSVNRQT